LGKKIVKKRRRRPPTKVSKQPLKPTTEESVSEVEETPALPEPAFPIVGIGASAGGIEPIRDLIGQLPATLGMAVIVVVHLDRKQPSRLVEVLAAGSALPVRLAEDGGVIEANHVYVIPPGKDLTLSCGMLQVTPHREERRLYDTIDCFMISMAREYGEQAIGVVLSGAGEDGSKGIGEVKARGGITFAQEESTAKQRSMPRAAIKSGVIDFVLSPVDIGKELTLLSKSAEMKMPTRTKAPMAKSEARLREVLLELLQQRTGVDFANYKQSTVWRRINRRMAIKRISSLREYFEYCKLKSHELEDLYQDILINVTSFFRDHEVFDSLERKVFPQIFKHAGNKNPLRIWVSGCSTGEEAYSLAIALLEFTADRNLSVPIQIFGTDINESVIERARSGIYADRIAETVSAERLEHYFTKVTGGYQVAKAVRDICVFARQNIVADPPLSKMDFISCRNLLIYLGPTLQRKVIPRLHYALKPNGYLVLGKSEVVDIFSDYFASVDKRAKIYSKKPAAPGNLDLGTGPSSYPPGTARKLPAPAGVFVELETQREMDRLIATRYSPPAIAINEALDILQVRGDIKPFLDMGSGLWNGNLSRLVQHDFVKTVRELVRRAISGKEASASREKVRLRTDGSVTQVNLKFVTLRSSSEKDRRFLIVLEPCPLKAKERSAPDKTSTSAGVNELAGEIARLEEELRLTREHLQSTIDEREIHNEELQSANEEILSNNEELQTMNQELETSKEELESSNEELATLNEELHRHLEQLRLSEERFRILVSGVKDYAIFMLDRNGFILSWNDGAERITGYGADEILGRDFSIFYPSDLSRTEKTRRVLAAAAEQGSYSEEGIRLRKDGRVFWAHAVVTALYDENGEVYGFAKLTRDIHEKKLVEEQLRLSEERFRILISGVKDYAIFMMDPDGTIVSWNPGAERINGYRSDEIIGQTFEVFYTEKDKARQHPQYELEVARKTGKYEEEGLRVRKDGSTFMANVLITALYDDAGTLRGYGKVTRDITDRKKAEQALQRAYDDLEKRIETATATVRKQEEQLRLITDALPTLVSYIGLDGRYTFNNASYERWFGRPVAEFTGERVNTMLGEMAYHEIRPHLEKALAGESVTFESKMMYTSGARYIRGSYIPDRDPQGLVRGVVALIEDVSWRKKNEEELRLNAENLEKMNAELAASNAELSQFAHISSHDLKEPLRMIKVYTQLIEEKYRDQIDDKGRQFMSFIIEGAARMDALINDLLAYSAVGRVDAAMGEADLARSASIAMSNLREAISAARAEVRIEQLPMVLGNESQLSQLLQNLIGNAIKFKRGDRPQIRVKSESRDDEWLISVEDNGIGMEPRYLGKIFVIFQRLHERQDYPGTGIGLAICKRIVERHGGKIWATSEPGKGTTFYFTLPKEK